MRSWKRWGQGGALALILSVTGALADDAPWEMSATYSDVQTFMRDLAEKYPGNAQLFDVGASDSGQVIQGLRIGNGEVKNLVVATHHGNEYGSTEVAKAVAAALAESPIRGQTVLVIPVLNIGGFNTRTRWESAGGRTHDPNRNYPGPCATEGPFTLKSTTALAQLVDRENVITSATLHTFYPAVVYPWGLSTRDTSTPYDDLFKQLSQAAVVESQYPIGNSTELIYPADGTYEDYAFWKHGVWSLLLELGRSHRPDLAAVREMNRVNVPGIRRMLEQAPRARADSHEFTGRCDSSLKSLDRHDE